METRNRPTSLGNAWMNLSATPMEDSAAWLKHLQKANAALANFFWFPRSRARRYTQVPPSRSAVIPAGMQESSAMDGNSPLCKCLIHATHQPTDSPPCDWIPAVHAGMTGFNHLCIMMSAPAWETGLTALRSCGAGAPLSAFPRRSIGTRSTRV